MLLCNLSLGIGTVNNILMVSDDQSGLHFKKFPWPDREFADLGLTFHVFTKNMETHQKTVYVELRIRILESLFHDSQPLVLRWYVAHLAVKLSTI